MMHSIQWKPINLLAFVSLSILIGCTSPIGPTEPLPKEFASYQPLNASYNNVNYKVELLTQSENKYFPYPIRVFENGHGQMIVETDLERNDDCLGYDYLKLNKEGDIIDSLFFPAHSVRERGFIGDFVLSIPNPGKPYYTTWPLNGDTIKREIAVLNEDFSWAEEKLIKKTEDILATAKYTFYTFSYPRKKPEDETCNKQLFFLKDNKWQVLYHKYEKNIYLKADEEMRHLRKDIYRTADDERPHAVQNFTLKYFEKKKHISYGHAIGGGQAGFSTNGWEGTAYFDVPLGDGFLKIKKDKIIVEYPTPAIPEIHYYNSHGDGGNVSNFALNFYTNPSYNFGLYSTSNNYLYIVRKKKSKVD